MNDVDDTPIENNDYWKEWLTDARKAGFTDIQLKFLDKWYKPPSSLQDLL